MNKKKRSLLKSKIQHNFHLLQENFTLFLFILMSKTKLQYKERMMNSMNHVTILTFYIEFIYKKRDKYCFFFEKKKKKKISLISYV